MKAKIIRYTAAFLAAATICVTGACADSAANRDYSAQTTQTDPSTEPEWTTEPVYTTEPECTTLPQTHAPETTVTRPPETKPSETKPSETKPSETKAPAYGVRSFTVISADSLNDHSLNAAAPSKTQIVSDRGTLDQLLDPHKNSSAQLPDDLKKVSSLCTESWFRTHRLIIVKLYEDSVSYEHDFLRVVHTGEGVRLEYKRWVPHGSDGAVMMMPMIAYPAYCIAVDDATLNAQDKVTLQLVTGDNQTDPDDDPAEQPDESETPQEIEKKWENRYKMFFGDEPLGSDSDAFMEQYFADYEKLSAMHNLDNVLIVIAPSIEDDFGAVFTVAGPNHSYYLQYTDEAQREAAYEKWEALVQEDKIVSVDRNYRIISFC